MSNDQILTFNVVQGTPETLLPFLFAAMPQRKHTDLKRLLAHDQVAVNSIATRQATGPLKPGDVVTVNLSRPFNGFHDPRLQLLYEDDDLIVVNKSAGLLSVAADNQRRRTNEGRGQETAFSIIRQYVKRQSPQQDLFIVHRLDRDTSGVLVFAKNEALQQELRYNWNNNVALRRYIAVVQGTPNPQKGIRESYLAENARYDVFSTTNPQEGKLAITRYNTLATGRGMALMEVLIDTGRKNQIRVHMKELGHPVVGDRRYGAKSSPIGRMCLHAQDLQFVHPFTRQMLSFSAPAPPIFHTLIEGSQSWEKKKI